MGDPKGTLTAVQDVSEQQVVLLIRFDTKPGQLAAFLHSLEQVVDIIRKESSFVDAVISQSLDRPNELLMYETWRGDRESWLRDELPRPYRAEYEKALANLVVSGDVNWFTPLTSWHAGLTATDATPRF